MENFKKCECGKDITDQHGINIGAILCVECGKKLMEEFETEQRKIWEYILSE